MTGRRAKVIPLSSDVQTVPEEAREFLEGKEGVRGMIVIAFNSDGIDAYATFGDVKRKDVAFMGSVLTAEAIGLDTGD